MTYTRRTILAGVGVLTTGSMGAALPDIFEAAATGNIARATELCNMVPGIVSARSEDGRTPLHYAAAAGQVDMVAFLNSKGADLSAGPESPMLAVADYPDHAVAEDMARVLLGNASDPNAKAKDGATVLHRAAAHGHAMVSRHLIHRGADVDASDAQGRKPLEVASAEAAAVLQGHANIERVYFGGRYKQDLRGAKVSRDDTYGLPQGFVNEFVTVAHFNPEKVRAMLKLCPSLLMTRATWDELAVEAAAHMGLLPLAEELAGQGSPISTCTAVLLGQSDMVKAMVRADHNLLRERGAHDLPLLFYTVFGKERPEIAEFLLQSGADVKASGFGQTALHLAAGKGSVETARLLLDHGADVNAATSSRKGLGPTPLAVAQKQKQSKMSEFLIERGGKT